MVDFKPVIGDWVIVSEKDVDTKNSCIYEMRPSRIRNFQGKVTTSSNRGCVVDNSVSS